MSQTSWNWRGMQEIGSDLRHLLERYLLQYHGGCVGMWNGGGGDRLRNVKDNTRRDTVQRDRSHCSLDC
jgi:hypothetical protein